MSFARFFYLVPSSGLVEREREYSGERRLQEFVEERRPRDPLGISLFDAAQFSSNPQLYVPLIDIWLRLGGHKAMFFGLDSSFIPFSEISKRPIFRRAMDRGDEDVIEFSVGQEAPGISLYMVRGALARALVEEYIDFAKEIEAEDLRFVSSFLFAEEVASALPPTELLCFDGD